VVLTEEGASSETLFDVNIDTFESIDPSRFAGSGPHERFGVRAGEVSLARVGEARRELRLQSESGTSVPGSGTHPRRWVAQQPLRSRRNHVGTSTFGSARGPRSCPFTMDPCLSGLSRSPGFPVWSVATASPSGFAHAQRVCLRVERGAGLVS
jgi:hypothetical protein